MLGVGVAPPEIYQMGYLPSLWDLDKFLPQKKLQKVSYRNASLLHFLNPHISQWAHLQYDSKYFFIKVGYTVIRFLDQAVILSALSMHAVDCIYIQHFKFNFWSLRPTVLPSIPPRFSFRTKLVLEACTLFIHIWKNKKMQMVFTYFDII